MMKIRYGVFVIVILLCATTIQTSEEVNGKVVLVTGFETFGSYTTNPSQIIAETLNGTTVDGAAIIGVVLPVDFNTSIERAVIAIEQYHPDLVISLGLNARAHEIRVEKVGINLKRYPKDDGTWSFPRRIDVSGQFLYLSPLSALTIVRTIREARISASISCFAGTYMCNYLLYRLLSYEATQNETSTIGFIHVPLLDSQDPAGMPLQSMVDAVTIAIQVSLG